MKKFVIVLFFVFGFLIFPLITDSVSSAPVFVSDCTNWNCVLTYPRYKLVQSNSDSNELWVAFQNARYDNFKKSIDGGANWNATTPTGALTIKDYLNYHASVVRDSSNNIHIADLGSSQIYYRKINYPGESATDMSPLLTLTSAETTGSSYAHVLAQDLNNIFIAYRVNNNVNGNVRYFKSSDGGATFPEEGVVYATGLNEVRIESFDLNGMPAVAIHHLNGGSGTDITYHVWNGTEFIENADYIVSINEALGWERNYNMIYVNGQLHATWSNGNSLRHAWKNYNGGVGTWNYDDVVTLGYTPQYAFQPSLSKRGNELYLIYSQIESATDGNIANVYYTKWNSSINSFGTITALTTDGGAGGLGYYVPHAPAEINPTSTFLPIIYSKAAFLDNSYGQVFYDGVSLDVQSVSSPYYVSTTGSDITGDGSSGNPWATITHAAAIIPIAGGSEIIVRDGVYSGRTQINRSYLNWVTIRSENPYGAVLTNPNPVSPPWDAALMVNGIPGESNVIIEDFEITNEYEGYTCSSREGFLILFTNMSNITLRNNIIHGNDAPGTCNDMIKVNRLGGGFPKNIKITGNVIYDPAPLAGADLLDSKFIGTLDVTDNIFFSTSNSHASQSFITIKDEIHSTHVDYETNVRNPRFKVQRNVFLNWDGRVDQAFIQFGEDADSEFMITNSLIENNLFIGNSPYQMAAPIQLKGTANITIRANTIVGNFLNSRLGANIGTEGSNPPVEGVYFYNNIFSDPNGTMGNDLINAYNLYVPSTFFIDNNLYWNNGNGLPTSGIITPSNDSNGYIQDPLLQTNQSNIILPIWNASLGTFNSGNTTIREEFERMVNLYGALLLGSPAIGIANSLEMPTDDILGNIRDGTVDVGAFEFSSCNLTYDIGCDRVINNTELGNALSGWFGGDINVADLFRHVRTWRA